MFAFYRRVIPVVLMQQKTPMMGRVFRDFHKCQALYFQALAVSLPEPHVVRSEHGPLADASTNTSTDRTITPSRHRPGRARRDSDASAAEGTQHRLGSSSVISTGAGSVGAGTGAGSERGASDDCAEDDARQSGAGGGSGQKGGASDAGSATNEDGERGTMRDANAHVLQRLGDMVVSASTERWWMDSGRSRPDAPRSRVIRRLVPLGGRAEGYTEGTDVVDTDSEVQRVGVGGTRAVDHIMQRRRWLRHICTYLTVRDLVTLSATSKRPHCVLRTEGRIWRTVARFGGVNDELRAAFWAWTCGAIPGCPVPPWAEGLNAAIDDPSPTAEDQAKSSHDRKPRGLKAMSHSLRRLMGRPPRSPKQQSTGDGDHEHGETSTRRDRTKSTGGSAALKGKGGATSASDNSGRDSPNHYRRLRPLLPEEFATLRQIAEVEMASNRERWMGPLNQDVPRTYFDGVKFGDSIFRGRKLKVRGLPTLPAAVSRKGNEQPAEATDAEEPLVVDEVSQTVPAVPVPPLNDEALKHDIDATTLTKAEPVLSDELSSPEAAAVLEAARLAPSGPLQWSDIEAKLEVPISADAVSQLLHQSFGAEPDSVDSNGDSTSDASRSELTADTSPKAPGVDSQSQPAVELSEASIPSEPDTHEPSPTLALSRPAQLAGSSSDTPTDSPQTGSAITPSHAHGSGGAGVSELVQCQRERLKVVLYSFALADHGSTRYMQVRSTKRMAWFKAENSEG